VTSPAPRAVVCGYSEIGTIGIECLIEAGFAVPLLITHEDAPGETIWWRPPAERALALGIEVSTPHSLDTPSMRARIAAQHPDFLFSFYYRDLIPPAVLALAPRGALNLHGSLLPRYRGRAPVNWVLVNGERMTGVTLHYMDEKADHGDIVDQAEIPIAFEDTARTLFDKLAETARVVLRRSLPRLARGTAPRRPQDHARATTFGRRTPDDGRIDWSWPAVQIHNLVRAVAWPWPGAFTRAAAGRLLIWRASPRPAAGSAFGMAPGAVLGPAEDGVLVACGEGTLLVREAQLDGAPPMQGPSALASALPRGARLG
jgi:methionyl-tRNA formyltransferase